MVVLSTSSPIEIILYKFQMSSVSSGVNLMVPGRFLVKCPQYPFMCRVAVVVEGGFKGEPDLMLKIARYNTPQA
jgi:hypothetical protein